jgi:hypothetical protein
MREIFTYGSVGGAPGNRCFYPELLAYVKTEKRRREMKNFRSALFVIATGLVFSASFSFSDMAKEGSGEYLSGKSGTFEILKLGKGRLQMNWEVSGVFVEAPENSPLLNASYHSIGTMHAVKGKSESIGGIIFTRPNGDQIFGTFTSSGILGSPLTSAIVEFTGGTVECTGIEGRMEGAPRPKVKSSKKGSWQAIGIGKVTWKIP